MVVRLWRLLIMQPKGPASALEHVDRHVDATKPVSISTGQHFMVRTEAEAKEWTAKLAAEQYAERSAINEDERRHQYARHMAEQRRKVADNAAKLYAANEPKQSNATLGELWPSSASNSTPLDDHESLCVVCCERPPSWVFITCGHKCICKPCARKQKNSGTVASRQSKNGHRKAPPMVLCPLCRTETRVVPELRHEGQVFET